uniref:ATP synthase subunit a n=1 Tax=Sinohyriopsis cumingii TaxID=165450 RepID=A0A0C4G3X3_SINCU|nr:ATP synthase F0 subunit 6 [Sinohyriopsis cumingii]
MLVDIFSSLDFYAGMEECDYMGHFFGYFSFLLGGWVLYCQKGHFWAGGSSWVRVERAFLAVMYGVVKDSKGSYFGGFGLGCVSLFFGLILLNFGGMIPGSLSASSHLSVSLPLGLTWWFWSVFSGLSLNWKGALAHLLPLGTPVALCPLMVLIETVSVVIRPITLSVRLVANITMGHLMLSLVGESLVGSFSMGVLGPYVLFEFFVCGLQAYVFSLLVVLYSADHPDSWGGVGLVK